MVGGNWYSHLCTWVVASQKLEKGEELGLRQTEGRGCSVVVVGVWTWKLEVGRRPLGNL